MNNIKIMLFYFVKNIRVTFSHKSKRSPVSKSFLMALKIKFLYYNSSFLIQTSQNSKTWCTTFSLNVVHHVFRFLINYLKNWNHSKKYLVCSGY